MEVDEKEEFLKVDEKEEHLNNVIFKDTNAGAWQAVATTNVGHGFVATAVMASAELIAIQARM